MIKVIRLAAIAVAIGLACSGISAAQAQNSKKWEVGTPITTYFAGPDHLTDATAAQMKAGGFNLVWASEAELDTAHKHGLRVFLKDTLLVWRAMDDPAYIQKLDALIERVKNHPAMYGYYIVDEPKAKDFPELGKVFAHLRARDPKHVAYVNLFPSWPGAEVLGTTGEPLPAYKEYLKQYMEIVKPQILSYDHYPFLAKEDKDDWFHNLALIRQTALEANIPFMNIVQACSWEPTVRVPNAFEMRWLNTTSLAYGSQGLSYFVYYFPLYYEWYGEKSGMMMRPDGSTTAQYDAAKKLNPQFVATAAQLQPLQSLGAYHVGKTYSGTEKLPENASFRLEFSGSSKLPQGSMPADGMLLGYFGAKGNNSKPTHAYVVNLDYRDPARTTIVGPGPLSVFNPATQKWNAVGGAKTTMTIAPGDGVLVKLTN